MLSIIHTINLVVILLLPATKEETDKNVIKAIQAETTISDNGLKNIAYFPNIGNIFNKVNDSRINGGEVVENIVPYQASLQIYRRNAWRHFCGGSIITAHHVLTAAHCVSKIDPKDLYIVVGTLTWNSGGQRHGVAAKRVHPQFSISPKIINDIAILKANIIFNLRPSTLGTVSLGSASPVGGRIQVRLTGWGATTPTAAGGLPNQLQQLKYQTISNAECSRKGFRVSGSEICALSNKGQGSCMGDSGGPLVTTQEPVQLVGVVSYGSATCAQGRPDVYSRVSSFLPYITKVITTEIP